MQKIIVDINIGNDICDIWALTLILSTNLFDVKLISVINGNSNYQVSLVAKILKLLNKNIPIACGIDLLNIDEQCPQKSWLEDFDLQQYQGKIYDSYFEAYEEILSYDSDVIVIGLAPLNQLITTISILKKYNIKIISIANISQFSDDLDFNLKKIISNDINITLIPFDISDKIVISGNNYKKIRNESTIITKIICENYDIWYEQVKSAIVKVDPSISSTVLYNLAPILYLLFPQNFDIVKKEVTVDKNKGDLKYSLSIALNIHKLTPMLKFVSEQYCTNFSYNKEIKQLEIAGMYSLTYVLKKCNVLLSVSEYGWEVHKSGSFYGPAVRDYYILHFITKGKGRLVVGNKEYIVKRGDIFLLPPKITTYYEADKKDPYTYYWVGFDGLEAKELLEKSGLIVNDNYVIHPKNYNSVFEMFSDFRITTTDNFVVPYQLVGKLYMLFSEIMSNLSVENEQKSNYVDLAIGYMNLNYSKNISIELLSRIIGVDRTYFYRLFKESTKISPKEYLTNLRIEKAKMLLCNSNMNIKEIAISVGFNNYLSFERVFKDKCGIHPTAYRKKNT